MITHNITLNVKNQNVVNTGIAVSQGDKGKVKFIIYVKDGDNYLSGAVSAEIAFNTPNGYIVTGNAVVENNSYTYVFEGNELQAAGDISAVITLTFIDGRVSSCGFTFYCRYNPMYDRNIGAGPYFGEIESLKSAAENALSDANGAVAQANAAKNAAEIAAGNAEAVAGIGIATTEKAGISKPDGTTLGIDAAGILRVLVSGLKIKDTNGLIGTVNADVLLQTLIDDITNRVVNQILTKSMLINNGLTTESGKYPLDAAFGKTLADKDAELASSIAQLNSDQLLIKRFQVTVKTSTSKDGVSGMYLGRCYLNNNESYPNSENILAVIPYGARSESDAGRSAVISYRDSDTYLGIGSQNQGDTNFLVQVMVLYKCR